MFGFSVSSHFDCVGSLIDWLEPKVKSIFLGITLASLWIRLREALAWKEKKVNTSTKKFQESVWKTVLNIPDIEFFTLPATEPRPVIPENEYRNLEDYQQSHVPANPKRPWDEVEVVDLEGDAEPNSSTRLSIFPAKAAYRRLIDCLIDWWIDRSVGWWIDRLVGWLIDWLIDWYFLEVVILRIQF